MGLYPVTMSTTESVLLLTCLSAPGGFIYLESFELVG